MCKGESEASAIFEGEGDGYEECDGVLSSSVAEVVDKDDFINVSASANRLRAMPMFFKELIKET